jgi:hypothetical protein
MNTRITGATAAIAVALVVVACSSPSASSAPPTTSPSEGSAAASQAAGPTDIGVTFTGTMPDGWVESDDGDPTPDSESAFFEVSQNNLVMAANCDLEPDAGVGSAAADILAAIEARDGIESSGPEDVTAGGLSGQQLDFHAAQDGTGATCGDQEFVPLWGRLEDVGWIFGGAGPTETHRVVVLDVPGGGTVFLWTSAIEPENVADYLDGATEVMNGLEFDVP